MDSKGEIVLTIMASLAQQESQSLSQNVAGFAVSLPAGEIQVNCLFLGYTKNENKKLIVVPEEAEIVKRIPRIPRRCQHAKIARGLEADGILNGAGHENGTPAISTRFYGTKNISAIYTEDLYR